MKLVRLQHPDLPGQVIEVPEAGVPHRRAAGWTFAPDPPPPEPEDGAETGPEDDAEKAVPESTTPRRRRKSEKE